MSLPALCPLCSADIVHQNVVTKHVFGSKNRQSGFFHCGKCDVYHMHPRFTPEEEKSFYAAEFESFMQSRSGDAGGWLQAERHISANKETYNRRIKYIEPHLSGVKNILEVGCSSGFMLYPLIDKGYQCSGVEPSGVFSEYVANKGINVYHSMDNIEKDKKFDLILHFFVLEHISNALEFLKEQIDFLSPGGKIIFEIPNAADALFTVYDIPAFERFYWSVAHPWYFTEKSLQYLLNQLGYPYELLFDQRYDLSNHMVWARDGKPGGMGRFTPLLGQEIEEAYKRNLVAKRVCDTLIGVIQKPK